jgi:predicted RNase H-like nuclease (RuvC/YqgF family)
LTVAITAVAVAVIAALGTYLGVVRKLSGKIATSEASSLWDESRSIRDDYRGQIHDQQQRMVTLESRVAKLEENNTNLINENVRLHELVRKLQEEAAFLAARKEWKEPGGGA